MSTATQTVNRSTVFPADNDCIREFWVRVFRDYRPLAVAAAMRFQRSFGESGCLCHTAGIVIVDFFCGRRPRNVSDESPARRAVSVPEIRMSQREYQSIPNAAVVAKSLVGVQLFVLHVR